MTKPTTHQHINFPCEACKNFEPRDDWELHTDICPESLQKGDVTKCPPLKWWFFKKGEDIPKCQMHAAPDPVIAKCPIPFSKTGKLLIWTPTTLSSLAMIETPGWPDAMRSILLDAMVRDGVNAERFASWVAPGDPLDPLSYYDFQSDAYWGAIHDRLIQYRVRDLTPIVTVSPYKAGITEPAARQLIQFLKPMLPNIIFECANEPAENYEQFRILEILQDEGVPLKNIMVAFVDSSDWFEMMKTVADLDDQGEIVKIKCLLSAHQFGSMETVNDTFGAGGNADKILSWGNFVASCDGPDKLLKSLGINFRYLAERGVDARRPNNDQLKELVTFFLKNGAGYEMLSAWAYRGDTTIGPDGGPVSWPNMSDARIFGSEERKTMSSAWMPGA